MSAGDGNGSRWRTVSYQAQTVWPMPHDTAAAANHHHVWRLARSARRARRAQATAAVRAITASVMFETTSLVSLWSTGRAICQITHAAPAMATTATRASVGRRRRRPAALVLRAAVGDVP